MSSIKRRPHCLKREKTLAMPRHIIFLDTESKNEQKESGQNVQRLHLGWVCYYRKAESGRPAKTEWHYFSTGVSFWQFVFAHTVKKRKLWVVSHNINFDFTIVKGWKHLKQAGYKLKFFYNSAATTIISVRSKSGSIVFVDSMNWFKESVETLGRRLGIPKINVDFATCTDEQLSLHCKRDVEILVAALKDFIRFLEANHISRLCYTIGSTAMAAYLLNYYDYKIYIHNNEQAIDLERAAFKGGRTECFRLGELNDGNYYILDVNSLYPAVMLYGSYPVKYRKITQKQSLALDADKSKSLAVIAECLVETDEPCYAVKHDRTIFPVGRFWTTLCTPEIVYGLKRGHIKKVGRAVFYDAEPIFGRYVKRFYTIRQEFRHAGIKTYEEICKLLLNSLYGKFGQKAEVWRKIGNCVGHADCVEDVFYPAENRRGRFRYLLDEVWELVDFTEGFNSFPAISAHVTAYGRMYLWGLMKQAGFGNYYYCDTDSLIVNEKGLDNLSDFLDEGKLGCLKIEEITPSLIIRGLKDYSTAAKTVIKGIRKNAVKIADGVFEQERWPSLKGLLRTGKPNVYTVYRQTKILDRRYTKGNVCRDGSIIPFELADSDEQSLFQL